MKTIQRPRSAARSGWAMVLVVLVIVAASSAVSLMLTSSATANRTASVARHSTTARYRAEGGLAAGKQALLQAVANWQPPPQGGSVVIDGVPVSFDVDRTDFLRVQTDTTGIQSTLERFEIRSSARYQGSQETVHRIVETEAIPIFQFAVFYTDDLEINPGPNMTLSGRVHTNGDLFLNSGGTLTLDTNYVHAVGNLYRHRKDDPSRSDGNILVREWVANTFDPAEIAAFFALNSKSQMAALGVNTVSGYDSNFADGFDADGDGQYDGNGDWLPWALGALEYWNQPDSYVGGTGNTILTSDHGLTAAVTPSVNSISMFEPASGGNYTWDPGRNEYVEVPGGTGDFQKGFFHSQAGLTVLYKPDGSWQAYDDRGMDVTGILQAAGAVSIDTMLDTRQGGQVDVVQIDISLLNGTTAFPSNGLFYAAGYENGTGREMNGVRLVNGSELAAPLTVVSEGSVYVQGDYNTVGQKGAAVIADAVNLLSNSWNDSKRPGSLPKATETTYNLAFISGNHETSVGAYNGGFENLPRFHENWSGVDCNIYGSFVNAWESQHATGSWVYGGDRYTAPNRNWSYDQRFNDVDNLPPFTPLVVTGNDLVTW